MTATPADINFTLRGAPKALMKHLHQIDLDVKAGRAERQTLEVLIEGCAGGGKTFGDVLLMWWLGHLYPGIRMLAIRCVKADLATTFQKILEEDICPANHPMLKRRKDRVSRRSYNLWNGPKGSPHPTIGATVIELGSMEDVKRHRGTDYDVVYFLELVELDDEGEWSEFHRSLRSWRSGIPFQLLFACTNPDDPGHWVNQRFPEAHEPRPGIMRLLSKLDDNPKFFLNGERTELGRAYRETLDKLHGVRRDRLRDAKWVAAEGVVYENFSRIRHIVKEAPPNLKWFAAAMDWGYRDPCCLLVGGADADGRVYIVAEIYRIEQPISWWQERVVELKKEFDLYGMVVSPDRPEVTAAFNEAVGALEIPWARPAENARASAGEGDMGGIDLVRSYLDDRADGKPGLLFVGSRLRYGPDAELQSRSQPTDTVREFAGYVYRKAPTGSGKLQTRMRELTDPFCADHGMDDLRYLLQFMSRRNPVRETSPETKYTREQIHLMKAAGCWPPPSTAA